MNDSKRICEIICKKNLLDFGAILSEYIENEGYLVKLNAYEDVCNDGQLSGFNYRILVINSSNFIKNSFTQQYFSKNNFDLLITVGKKNTVKGIDQHIHFYSKKDLFVSKILLLINYISNSGCNNRFDNFTEKDCISAYKETIQTYNDKGFINKYFETWGKNLPTKLLNRFLYFIPKGAKVLDSGCGPGHHSDYISKQGYKVFGIDLSKPALEIAKTNFPYISFNKMDMLETSFKENFFFGIWSCASAVHLPPNLFVKQVAEFARLLTNNGILGLTISAGKRQCISPDGRYFYSFNRIDDVLEILKTNNFKLLRHTVQNLQKTTFSKSTIGVWNTIYAKKL